MSGMIHRQQNSALLSAYTHNYSFTVQTLSIPQFQLPLGLLWLACTYAVRINYVMFVPVHIQFVVFGVMSTIPKQAGDQEAQEQLTGH